MRGVSGEQPRRRSARPYRMTSPPDELTPEKARELLALGPRTTAGARDRSGDRSRDRRPRRPLWAASPSPPRGRGDDPRSSGPLWRNHGPTASLFKGDGPGDGRPPRRRCVCSACRACIRTHLWDGRGDHCTEWALRPVSEDGHRLPIAHVRAAARRSSLDQASRSMPSPRCVVSRRWPPLRDLGADPVSAAEGSPSGTVASAPASPTVRRTPPCARAMSRVDHPERGFELLAEKRAQGPSPASGRRRRRRRPPPARAQPEEHEPRRQLGSPDPLAITVPGSGRAWPPSKRDGHESAGEMGGSSRRGIVGPPSPEEVDSPESRVQPVGRRAARTTAGHWRRDPERIAVIDDVTGRSVTYAGLVRSDRVRRPSPSPRGSGKGHRGGLCPQPPRHAFSVAALGASCPRRRSARRSISGVSGRTQPAIRLRYRRRSHLPGDEGVRPAQSIGMEPGCLAEEPSRS